MSRIRSRNIDICGDCSASDPTWASVNRGILLCTECCSIHRSLGQHISQIKSLKKSQWYPKQLEMFNALVAAGANNIWEHCLLDNSTKFAKKKPQPKDCIRPNKSDFIHAKHKNCRFILKAENDGLYSAQQLQVELSKQLHSSVRTSNLDTSLRLLVQGADPNYFHDEKGSTPLHVAAKSNQILQTELLLTYGADPRLTNTEGQTAIQIAKLSENLELYNRLTESMYEVIDRLTFYLCGKKPDHKSGQNLLIPEPVFSTNLNAKAKLQMLPNQLFKELVLDVYEEIDRRETEAIWLSNVDCLNLGSVPFLPVDSRLSSTRNQGRQKLARYTVTELRKLINDILIDLQRRNSIEKRQMNLMSLDDDHLYDSVASDDYDYVTLPPINESVENLCENEQNDKKSNENVVEILTQRLLKSDDTITELRDEIKVLKSTIVQLKKENSELKTSVLALTECNKRAEQSQNQQNGNSALEFQESTNDKKCLRPMSMFEIKSNSALSAESYNNLQKIKNCRNKTDMGIELTRLTEFVTKGIQELWSNVQSDDISKKISCVSHFNKIQKSIQDFVKLAPQDSCAEDIEKILTQTALLKTECIGFRKAVLTDSPELNYYTQQVRLCAYEICKMLKFLLSKI